MIAAPAVVAASVGVGIAIWPEAEADYAGVDTIATMRARDQEDAVSRSGGRSTPSASPTTAPPTAPPTTPPPTTPPPTPAATPTPTPLAVTATLFTTVGLNVRTDPAEDADVLTVLDRGAEVGVTGATDGEWAQIVYDGQAYWVSAEYLSETEPPPETTGPDGDISYAECESGSGVEEGLTNDAIRVHRAVCAAFPEVSSYGGLRSDGEHGEGRALDIMVSSQSLGDAIAAWVRENRKALGVSEVLWWQQIWTVERSDEGWRQLEDRGSDTANHYDHVHVTVYGDSGG